MNRGLALAINQLDSGYSSYLYCKAEEIDYLPSKKELSESGSLGEIIKFESLNPDIVIYNNFPKTITSNLGLKALKGGLKFAYLAWEESVYPENWVSEINENLDGVMVCSRFVKEILIKSGVKVPVIVIAIGLDDYFIKNPPPRGSKPRGGKFKFLHISSGKARKGVDLLIKAFTETFKQEDPVSLMLKIPHHSLSEFEALTEKNSPEIKLIDKDLGDDEIRELHLSSDCEIYPSRAEGFGLPMLESLYFGKPLITTAYSGQMDFCSDQNSFLLNYTVEKISADRDWETK